MNSEEQDMFGNDAQSWRGELPMADSPLADRMRPRSLDEFEGQEELLGPNSLLRDMIAHDRVSSMIFWGPPGSGKTTLASIIAASTHSDFIKLSAVTSGLADVRRVMDGAKKSRSGMGRRTILFIDEIHRFNKTQQDAFLPHVEDGTITLIGATTENPSFSVIGPLLSRCRVLTLKALSVENVVEILRRGLHDEKRGLGDPHVGASVDFLRALAQVADGDARRALNLLELAARHAPQNEQGLKQLDDPALIEELTRRTHLFYDKSGEEHYNLISALHKSLRKSDPDAAIYWLERMLQSGEDPRYTARRMIRFASEDVGMADPQALPQAIAAAEAFERLGSPEGELALIQCAVYLATAPKSNSLYAAEHAAKDEIEKSSSLPTPIHLRNAPTRLMKEIGYGREYQYDHDAPDHYAPQRCLPENLKGPGDFYKPGEFGFEKEVRKRLEWWRAKRQEKG